MERRLSSPKNLVRSMSDKQRAGNASLIFATAKTRGPEADAATRTVAAILAATKTPEAKKDLKDLDITPAQISSAKNSPKIADKTKAGNERVRELALDKLMQALGLMDDDKFERASLKELSTVARDMSRVVESTSPRDQRTPAMQIIIHAPSQKSEDSYLTVDV